MRWYVPTLAFIALATLSGLFAWKHRANVTIAATHKWPIAPMVVRCPDAPVTLAQIKSAMRWIDKRGGRWAGPPLEGKCEGQPGPLEAWVLGAGPIANTNYAGLSEIQTVSGWGMWTRVWLQPIAAQHESIIVHELLHVQGLDHVKLSSHILSDSAELGGWDDSGVREALRAQWD